MAAEKRNDTFCYSANSYLADRMEQGEKQYLINTRAKTKQGELILAVKKRKNDTH